MTHFKATAIDALRRLGADRRVLPLTALLLRARTVRQSTAFVLREASARRTTFAYRLRENGLQVAIRHRTGDVVTLGEVFHDRQYDPPRAVEQSLGSVASVLDLGANIGLFGALAAARWPQAEIVGFEPDPANADVHERTIALNGLERRWRLIRAAAGVAAGRAEFVAGGQALAHLADPHESDPVMLGTGERRIEVDVQDVLAMIADVDVLKLDIEGGEWAILGDRRFREAPPRAVVLEYHPRFCPSEDSRGAVEAALRAAGLRIEPIWHGEDGHGMLWGWRG